MKSHISENRENYFMLFHFFLLPAVTLLIALAINSIIGVLIVAFKRIVDIGALFAYLLVIFASAYYVSKSMYKTLIKYGLLPDNIKPQGSRANPLLNDDARFINSLGAAICVVEFVLIIAITFSDIPSDISTAFGGLLDLIHHTAWVFIWFATWRIGRDHLNTWLRKNDCMPEALISPVNSTDTVSSDQETEKYVKISSLN